MSTSFVSNQNLYFQLNLPPSVKLSDLFPSDNDADDGSSDTKKLPPNRAIEPAIEQPVKSMEPEPEDDQLDISQIPKLAFPHKVAAIKWQQNDAAIVLNIEAPDILAYDLVVTNSVLDFT